MGERRRTDVRDLFQNESALKVCAPMVRYSKLEFRTLVRKYGCDLCFTPMIMADSFVRSEKARQNELTTNDDDTPVLVQFAAKNVDDFVDAAELVSPFSDGVDLNCGCPQKWAMSDGYGAHLLTEPQKIKEMVLTVRNRIPHPYTVSVKLRIMDDLRKSIEMCRSFEAAGASFLTVHGRTAKQKNDDVNFEAIKSIVESVHIPVIGNGGVKNLKDFNSMQTSTNCQGVMVAGGILQNPALFSGFDKTPLSCVQDWVDISTQSEGLKFECFHHHLVFMLEKVLPKEIRLSFNKLNTFEDVLDSLNQNLGVTVDPKRSTFTKNSIAYDPGNCGKYFKTKIDDDLDLCDSWFCT